LTKKIHFSQISIKFSSHICITVYHSVVILTAFVLNHNNTKMNENAQRDANTACVLAVVRSDTACPLQTPTDRTDNNTLAAKLSAQCNKTHCWHTVQYVQQTSD